MLVTSMANDRLSVCLVYLSIRNILSLILGVQLCQELERTIYLGTRRVLLDPVPCHLYTKGGYIILMEQVISS